MIPGYTLVIAVYTVVSFARVAQGYQAPGDPHSEETIWLNKPYRAGSVEINMMRIDSGTIRIRARAANRGQSGAARTMLDFQPLAAINRVSVTKVQGGVLLALTQRTHFGAVDVFSVERKSMAVRHAITCISADLSRLASGIGRQKCT